MLLFRMILFVQECWMSMKWMNLRFFARTGFVNHIGQTHADCGVHWKSTDSDVPYNMHTSKSMGCAKGREGYIGQLWRLLTQIAEDKSGSHAAVKRPCYTFVAEIFNENWSISGVNNFCLGKYFYQTKQLWWQEHQHHFLEMRTFFFFLTFYRFLFLYQFYFKLTYLSSNFKTVYRSNCHLLYSFQPSHGEVPTGEGVSPGSNLGVNLFQDGRSLRSAAMSCAMFMYM